MVDISWSSWRKFCRSIYFLPVAMPRCFSFCGSTILHKIKGRANHLFLFFKIVLGNFGPLLFHANFNISLSITMESLVVIFLGNMYLNINLKVIAFFKILSFFYPMTWCICLCIWNSFYVLIYKCIIFFINFSPFCISFVT